MFDGEGKSINAIYNFTSKMTVCKTSWHFGLTEAFIKRKNSVHTTLQDCKI